MVTLPKVCLIERVVSIIPSQLSRAQKKAQLFLQLGFRFGRLAIPYFRMANCHTIIGTKRFHFRVRDGVGWFTLAMVTKQSGLTRSLFLSQSSEICV